MGWFGEGRKEQLIDDALSMGESFLWSGEGM